MWTHAQYNLQLVLSLRIRWKLCIPTFILWWICILSWCQTDFNSSPEGSFIQEVKGYFLTQGLFGSLCFPAVVPPYLSTIVPSQILVTDVSIRKSIIVKPQQIMKAKFHVKLKNILTTLSSQVTSFIYFIPSQSLIGIMIAKAYVSVSL